ncbi:leucyl aminopeptidase [Melaminivora sp.]|uniref:leucyl aminopeptidase n=1 Tax=Melaminivora sp. TaxID=1933032 RepID=UPI0028B1650A|nr:leucyl aminopeptidase [Melaminivora sp.]
MNFELKSLTLPAAARHKCDLLAVLVPEGFAPAQDAGAVGALIARALSQQDLETKPGKMLQLYAPEGVAARRLLMLGCGDGGAQATRKAVLALAAALRQPAVRKAAVVLAGTPAPGAVQATICAAAEAVYVYSATKSKNETHVPDALLLGMADAAAARSEFATGQALATGIGFAREWANRPANHATPSLLADAARELANLPGIQCTVRGPAEVAKLGMGAFLAVAQGSEQPLRFIELRYGGAAKAEAPVVLVGKGITFDTGGISLKPAPEMDEMKFDMGGAASVLGVFRALAELQPAINVVGLIPACENMPDGRALKPGDVVTSMSGQTIEVLNTDAEGRLVLCDALTYAARFKPRALIDIATLTGACVIALGGLRSGLFSTSDALAAELQGAGEAALDPCWRMPLDDEYGEGLKSNFADVANVAGRPAGSVTAAKFLQRFVGDLPWAHLDIAGTAWKGGAAKGATGRPVGLLVEYLIAQAGQAPAAQPHAAPKAAAKAGSKTAPKSAPKAAPRAAKG